jgi:hypothetical protein
MTQRYNRAMPAWRRSVPWWQRGGILVTRVAGSAT